MTPNYIGYHPKDPALKEIFDTMRAVGNTRSSDQGRLSNAHCVARDTGEMPSWCAPGTPVYAAAKAGLCARIERDRVIEALSGIALLK